MVNLRKAILSKRFRNTENLFSSLLDEPYAVIKGEPLSLLAYGKTAMRHVGDIDILISRDNMGNLLKCLDMDGFEPSKVTREEQISAILCSHQILPFTKRLPGYGDVTVDINFDIFWGEYEGKRVDINSFLSDALYKEIYGVAIKTLPPLKNMVQLVLHHYKDMNSIFLLSTRKIIKRDMLRDVYFLLKNNVNDITLDKLYTISAEYEILPYMFYIFFYVGEIFHDEIIDKYTNAFRTRKGEELLDCYGLCEKERKKWRYNFETRLASNNIYDLIKEDLTAIDKEKIAFNKHIF
jgi:hypothetical protein